MRGIMQNNYYWEGVVQRDMKEGSKCKTKPRKNSKKERYKKRQNGYLSLRKVVRAPTA
jgi:hypothetical protein